MVHLKIWQSVYMKRPSQKFMNKMSRTHPHPNIQLIVKNRHNAECLKWVHKREVLKQLNFDSYELWFKISVSVSVSANEFLYQYRQYRVSIQAILSIMIILASLSSNILVLILYRVHQIKYCYMYQKRTIF